MPTSQHSELHENEFKDDLKIHFKDDLPFSQEHTHFTKKTWEIMLPLDGPAYAVLCRFGCPILKKTQLMRGAHRHTQARLSPFVLGWRHVHRKVLLTRAGELLLEVDCMHPLLLPQSKVNDHRAHRSRTDYIFYKYKSVSDNHYQVWLPLCNTQCPT